MSCNSPILFITFNRPDSTQRVLAEIMKVKPKKLYVFSDAPRENNEEDKVKVRETRELFQGLESKVDLHTKFQQKNLGCARGVTTAINWIFETEEQAIILEDDCLPSESFFNFCDYALEKYSSNDSVMHVAGTNWSTEFPLNESYLFSFIAHIWGWATWKRAWLKYDCEMKDWTAHFSKVKDSLRYPALIQYWKELFDSIANTEHKHTWDYQWQYTIFKEKGLCVIPNCNLISNIGTQGTHTSTKKNQRREKYVFNAKMEKWSYISSPTIKRNSSYDIFHMRHHFFKFNRIGYIKKSIKYLIND